MKIFVQILTFLFLFTPKQDAAPFTSQERLAVIIHSDIETTTLSMNELLEVYTLRRQNWDDDSRIRVADYKGNNELRRWFYSALNTSPNNVKKIWLRAQFTGLSIPPKVVGSVEDMIKQVLENPGTVGYVPLNEVPPNTLILLEIERE